MRQISKANGKSLKSTENDFMEASLGDFGWGPGQLATELESDYSCYWFLYEGDRILAYVAGTLLFGELEILRVYSRPDMRGRGMAKELLQAVLQDEAVDLAFLEVRSQYKAAVNLYVGVGFESISIRENYYKHPVDDAINMIWKEE